MMMPVAPPHRARAACARNWPLLLAFGLVLTLALRWLSCPSLLSPRSCGALLLDNLQHSDYWSPAALVAAGVVTWWPRRPAFRGPHWGFGLLALVSAAGACAAARLGLAVTLGLFLVGLLYGAWGWTCGGYGRWRSAPIAALLFWLVVPEILDVLTLPLQFLSAWVTGHVAEGLFVSSFFREGTTFYGKLHPQGMQIASECAGVAAIKVLLSLGMTIGLIIGLRTRAFCQLLTVSVLLGLLMNWVRLLIILAAFVGVLPGEWDFYHNVGPLGLSATMAPVLLICAWWLERRQAARPAPADPAAPAPDHAARRRRCLAVATLSLAFLPSAEWTRTRVQPAPLTFPVVLPKVSGWQWDGSSADAATFSISNAAMRAVDLYSKNRFPSVEGPVQLHPFRYLADGRTAVDLLIVEGASLCSTLHSIDLRLSVDAGYLECVPDESLGRRPSAQSPNATRLRESWLKWKYVRGMQAVRYWYELPDGSWLESRRDCWRWLLARRWRGETVTPFYAVILATDVPLPLGANRQIRRHLIGQPASNRQPAPPNPSVRAVDANANKLSRGCFYRGCMRQADLQLFEAAWHARRTPPQSAYGVAQPAP